MGFLDGKIVHVDPQYQHLDLNEGNVDALFARCVTGPLPDAVVSQLFLKSHGYEADEKPVCFSRLEIQKNKSTIAYWLGQLKNVHSKKRVLTPQEAAVKYTGVKWTGSKEALLKFLHLCEAVSKISPFVASSGTANLYYLHRPSVSPRDPDFSAGWYEEWLEEFENRENTL